MSRRSSGLLCGAWSTCRVTAYAPMGPVRQSAETVAAAELGDRSGDAFLHVLIEELPLRDVDRNVDILPHAAPRDPGWDAIRNHLASDVDANQCIVFLGDADHDLEHEPGAFDEPPAALPAKVAVVIAREVHGVICDDGLTFDRCSLELRADMCVQLL